MNHPLYKLEMSKVCIASLDIWSLDHFEPTNKINTKVERHCFERHSQSLQPVLHEPQNEKVVDFRSSMFDPYLKLFCQLTCVTVLGNEHSHYCFMNAHKLSFSLSIVFQIDFIGLPNSWVSINLASTNQGWGVGRDDFYKAFGHETRSIGYQNKQPKLYGRV